VYFVPTTPLGTAGQVGLKSLVLCRSTRPAREPVVERSGPVSMEVSDRDMRNLRKLHYQNHLTILYMMSRKGGFGENNL
jgi:hypothetical protein